MGAEANSWLITIIVFFAVLFTIFFLSKNFRRFLYGAVVTGFLLIVYHFSRWIGLSTVRGDIGPVKWTGYVIGFILVSILLGKFVQKTKFVKNLEKKLEVNSDEKRHARH